MTSKLEPLTPYYAAAREETELRKQLIPSVELGPETYSLITFAGALAAEPDVAVIAEHKRRSPSEGDIRPDSTVEETVAWYSEGGASAVSILTQERHFGGRLPHIAYARDTTTLPILRKDFISDPYQLYEAKAYGAHAALLIVAGLTDLQLRDLQREADAIELETLIEVHNEDELQRALAIDPKVVGVNNRNLSTLTVDIATADQLLPQIPDGIVTVAESGYSVRDPDHIRRLRALGADAVLMGTALMRQENPAEALRSWLAVE